MRIIKHKYIDTHFDYRLSDLENRPSKRQVFTKWYRDYSPSERQEEVWYWCRYDIAELKMLKSLEGFQSDKIRWWAYDTRRMVWDKRPPEGYITGFACDTYYSIRAVHNSKPVEKSKWEVIDQICRLFLAKELKEKDDTRKFFIINVGKYDRRRIKFVTHNKTCHNYEPFKDDLKRFAKGETIMMATCVELWGSHVGALRCLAAAQKTLEPYVATEIRYHGCVPDSEGYVLYPFNKIIWDDTYFTAATYRRQSWLWFVVDHIWFVVGPILVLLDWIAKFLITPVPNSNVSEFYWCMTVLWPHRINLFVKRLMKYFA